MVIIAQVMRRMSRGGGSGVASIDSMESGVSCRDHTDTFKFRVYELVDEPRSSHAAQVVNAFVMTLIVISVGFFIGETIPELKDASPESLWLNAEATCSILFSVELVVRFWACNAIPGRTRWQFVCNLLNILDFAAVAPWYVEQLVKDASSSKGLRVLRVVRLTRVLRMLKLGRSGSGMVAMKTGLQASVYPLFLLFLVFFLGVLVFSTLMYFAEDKWPETQFVSIPAGFWWCFVTMLTVGYGDFKPISPLGKVIGTFTMVTGILLMSLPMAIIASKFQEAYASVAAQKRRQRARISLKEGNKSSEHLMKPFTPSEEAQELIELGNDVNEKMAQLHEKSVELRRRNQHLAQELKTALQKTMTRRGYSYHGPTWRGLQMSAVAPS